MSPYFSNSFVDANFFDKTDPVEDKAVDDILVLASNDEINLLIPYSVKYEIEHPNTPTDVKLKLSELIYSIKVQLNSNEIRTHKQVQEILQGNCLEGKHKKDAFHVVESEKCGGKYFITKDQRLLDKAVEIFRILPIKILKPSEYLIACGLVN